jgi:hypothetical protein
MINAYIVLLGIVKGSGYSDDLGVDGIKMSFREIVWENVV